MQYSIQQLLQFFEPIVGQNNIVYNNKELLMEYGKDSTHLFNPNPALIIFPQNTEEVSKILYICNQHDIKIVPSAGRTGLSGGAVATNNEVILSVEKINKIEWLDKINMCMKVQAGVTLEEVKEYAKKFNLFFPVDTASKGSAKIGGNLATNVGGLNFIKYQGIRNHVLGLEVVLADGRILNLNRALHKNNCGYDLKHLFIGSEGTLGIITSAILKLSSQPKKTVLSCLADNSFDNIIRILEHINKKQITPIALEFFSKNALDIVLAIHKHLHHPTSSQFEYYVLLEIEDELNVENNITTQLFQELIEQNLVSDGVIAYSSKEYKELWAIRENISESIFNTGWVLNNDLSLPISYLKPFIAEMNQYFQSNTDIISNIQWAAFGHIGDGNIHISIFSNTKNYPKEKFIENAKPVINHMLQQIKKYGGSISAEHGIGLLKKNFLSMVCSDIEIEIMKQIKKIFDSKNILNPNKIFDLI